MLCGIGLVLWGDMGGVVSVEGEVWRKNCWILLRNGIWVFVFGFMCGVRNKKDILVWREAGIWVPIFRGS